MISARSSREWRAGYAPQCARLMDELGVATPEGLLRCCEDTSESSEVRVKACYALGFLKAHKAVPALIKAADDDNPQVSCQAILSLSVLGSRRATRPLMRIVRHSANEEVRNMAVLCLGQLCDKRAETLVCNLLARAESEATRSYAAQALSRLSHSEQSFQAVLKALSDVHALVRWTAAAALGSIGDRRAVGPLRSALSDREVIPTLPAEETVAEAAKRALDQFLRAEAGAPKGVHKRAAETGKKRVRGRNGSA